MSDVSFSCKPLMRLVRSRPRITLASDVIIEMKLAISPTDRVLELLELEFESLDVAFPLFAAGMTPDIARYAMFALRRTAAFKGLDESFEDMS